MTKATIQERGNGLPDVGDYVSGDDGNLYRVTSLGGTIHTGRPGQGNYVYGEVELADWSDVDDDSEPVCSAVLSEDEA
jgi:hypothetical protein